MRLLLDTHIYWWWSEGNAKLSVSGREMIEAAQEVYVSLVSFWEIAIKTRTDKLQGGPLLAAGLAGLAADGFLPLQIEYAHIFGTMDLPPHHRDPFDRLLIAQAQTEGLTLVTSDNVFARYGFEPMW